MVRVVPVRSGGGAPASALLVALAAAGCTPSGSPSSSDRAHVARPRSTGPSTTTTTARRRRRPPPRSTCPRSRRAGPIRRSGNRRPCRCPPTSRPRSMPSSADARIAPNAASVSVWIDGLGEVLTRDPDVALAPASNQKLLTADGRRWRSSGPTPCLATEVRLAPSGDLVIVPGGDPTLASAGPHSLAELAAQVRARGATQVAGALLVDETRHDGARRAPPDGRTGRSRPTPGRCRH